VESITIDMINVEYSRPDQVHTYLPTVTSNLQLPCSYVASLWSVAADVSKTDKVSYSPVVLVLEYLTSLLFFVQPDAPLCMFCSIQQSGRLVNGTFHWPMGRYLQLERSIQQSRTDPR